DIRREATLHLAALRTLGASTDEQRQALQRYILGLSLVAFTRQPDTYLRQGCNLVLDPDRARETVAVFGNGRREPVSITGDECVEYWRETTAAFGLDPVGEIGAPIGPDREVHFDRDAAKADVGGDAGEGTTKRGRKRGR